MLPEYKSGRNLVRITNWDVFENLEDEHDAKVDQIVRLIHYLKCLPVKTLSLDKVEADDIIAYLSTGPLRNFEKIIVSSDKDMYQLLDEKTKIYSLHKKTFVTSESLFEEFRITSANFALAKCLCGDVSDNVPGVKGIGFKSVVKKFPILGNEDPVILDDLLSYAASHASEGIIYRRVIEEAEIVKRNWILHLQ